MATCTKCGAELAEGAGFCTSCGQPVEVQLEPAAGSGGRPVPAQASAFSISEKKIEGGQVEQATVSAQPSTPGGRGATIGISETEVGKGATIGTVIIGGEAKPQEVYCASCGKPLALEERRKCPKCAAIVCINDYKFDARVCRCCTPIAFEALVSCGICHKSVPKSETFECPRCKVVADKGHLDAKLNLCEQCAAKHAQLVNKLKEGETVVTQSGVITTADDYDHLVASRKGLRTPDGQQVATIKPQVWYARQWYQIKRARLDAEAESMGRFYPHMELHTATDGTKYWEGPLTTWRGKDYVVRIVYPAYFPYQPPKAYIVSPKVKQSRHIYEDGHLCMFHPDDHTWLPTTTAATVISWVSRWLHSYEVWEDTGEWPGQEHDQEVIATKY